MQTVTQGNWSVGCTTGSGIDGARLGVFRLLRGVENWEMMITLGRALSLLYAGDSRAVESLHADRGRFRA